MTRPSTAGRIARRIAIGVAAGVVAVAATAQDARIEQIPAAAPPRDVPIAAPDARPPAQLSRSSRGEAPAQLSRAVEARAPMAQLSRGPRTTSAPPQVNRGGRSAQASAPLSSPGESRPGPVVRVAGKDRCDAGAADRPVDCARVIETRSGEFVRPNPLTLTAEQRLLIDQRTRDMPTTTEGWIRRVGRNDLDADTSEAQSIASVVLPAAAASAAAAAAKPAAGEDASANPAGDAAVLSVIQALAGGTPVVTTPPK